MRRATYDSRATARARASARVRVRARDRASEPDLAPRDVGELARMPRELRRRGGLRRPAKPSAAEQVSDELQALPDGTRDAILARLAWVRARVRARVRVRVRARVRVLVRVRDRVGLGLG